jgi:nitrogen fixation NifU-like protein
MSKMEEDIDRVVKEIQTAIIEDTRKDYSEKVVEYWLNPRNFGEMVNPDGFAKLTGPCGDTMQIFIKVKGEKITDACFITDGCGPSVVAGGMATKLAKGRSLEAARDISQEVILAALGGLPEESVHCALLASNTLNDAIENYLTNKK